MILKPIIAELEAYAKKVPVEEWTEEDTPKNIWEFHDNIKTSSDDFWYCLNNGYIDLELITDTKLQDLTKLDLDVIEQIVDDYGFEF